MMKIKIILVLITLFSTFRTFGVVVNLSDFNISPSNKNNTDGFLKLNKWLRGKKDIVINFKPGIYWVGQQKPSDMRVVENVDNIFSLYDCTNIQINGNGATIKFIANLKYGAFDAKSKAKLNHKGAFRDSKNAAYPGNCIYLNNSKNVTINGLVLDGNSDHLIIGGIYGDNGIQLWHRGIYVINSFNVKLSNLYIHHFGLDGIEISNNSLSAAVSKYQTQILNVKCYYNGRQGISWTGGNGLLIENSEFSHTGKGKLASNPGCGIDIEPEVNKCINGLIVNCKFENNTGYAFGTEYFKLPIEQIEFRKCVFGGTTGGALFPANGGVTITNCVIYGQIVRPAGISINQRVVIQNSSIYDYNPNNQNIPKFATNHLIDAGGHKSYFDFINCDIYLRKVKLCYIESGVTEYQHLPSFKNNRVYFNANQYTRKDFIALFRGVILADNIFKINYKDSGNNGNFLHTGSNVVIKGTNTITGNNQYIGWNNSNGPKTLK